MTRKEIIIQLEGLVEYATDEMRISDCNDIWAKDAEALRCAILTIKMFADMLENLEGQDMLTEMVWILSTMGYIPEEFEKLGICTAQEAEEYIHSEVYYE